MISIQRDNDREYQTWFQDRVDIQPLDANILYTWVETPVENNLYQVEIDAEVIAPINNYRDYSAGMFWQIIRNLRQTKRKYYQQKSFLFRDKEVS